MPPTSLSTPYRLLLGTAALVVVAAGIRAAVDIVVPLLLAVFIAIICEAPMDYLKRRGAPLWLAMVLVSCAIVAVMMFIGTLIGDSARDFTAALPAYEKLVTEQGATLIAWLKRHGFSVAAADLMQRLNPAAAVGLIGGFVNSLGGLLANTFLIFLTVVFILLEASLFPAKLQAVLKTPRNTITRMRDCTRNINRYLAIKSLSSFATGTAVASGLTITGVDFPLLWGLLAFFLNYVPTIGSFIAAVPAVLLAWVQLGAGGALATALVFLVVNVVIGNFIEPRILGRNLGLSPLVVLLSLILWGWLLGPVGMFLSAPLTMVLRIALESSEHTHYLAVLLSGGAEIKIKRTRRVSKNKVKVKTSRTHR